MTICDIDLRVGGAWRFVQQASDGAEYAFWGVYQEIDPPKRVVFTECYEAMPGHEYLGTGVLEELDVAPRTVDVPEDLATALAAQPGATEAFAALSYTMRKEYVRQGRVGQGPGDA